MKWVKQTKRCNQVLDMNSVKPRKWFSDLKYTCWQMLHPNFVSLIGVNIICLSVRSCSRNWPISFSDVLHECKILWELKTEWVQFFKKILIGPISSEKGHKWHKNGISGIFWKKLLNFSGNNLILILNHILINISVQTPNLAKFWLLSYGLI